MDFSVLQILLKSTHKCYNGVSLSFTFYYSEIIAALLLNWSLKWDAFSASRFLMITVVSSLHCIFITLLMYNLHIKFTHFKCISV